MPIQHRLAYQPALDGLRGLAVALVLLFHGGFSWMSGGYVGVSVFFTMSGYLITSLLLAEVDFNTWEREPIGQGPAEIDISGFYVRRLRRLLPASLLCLVAVTIAAAAGAFRVVDGLSGQIIAAAAQVENWFALSKDTSYSELLTGVPSPVDHFWSLSIEEQFYWVWPWVFLFIVRRWSTPRSRFRAVATLTAVALVAAPLIALRWGPDAAYWATPARVGEILTGATLAFAVQLWRLRPPSWLAPVSLAAIVVAAILLPSQSGPAFSGWLGFGSLVSVGAIAGLQSSSSATNLLSARPLVALGRISYGVYLAHWPIFLALDRQRVGIDGLPLFAVRLAVTLLVAVASFELIEQPIRRGGYSMTVARQGRVAMVGAASTLAVVSLAIVAVPRPHAFGASTQSQAAVSIAPNAEVEALSPVESPNEATTDATESADDSRTDSTDDKTVDVADSVTTTAAPVSTRSTTTTSTTLPPGPSRALVAATRPDAGPYYSWSSTTTVPRRLPTPSRPVRVLVVGDSTAMALGEGLIDFAKQNPDLLQVDVIASPFCGLVDSLPDQSEEVVKGCAEQERQLSRRMSNSVPDVVVVLISRNDQLPRWFVEGDPAVNPADYRDYIAMGYQGFTDQVLAAPNTRVLWILPAPAAHWWLGFYRSDHLTYPAINYEPQRTQIEDLIAANPTRMASVNLDDVIAPIEVTEDQSWRKDGLHLEPAAALTVVEEQTWPAIVELALG